MERGASSLEVVSNVPRMPQRPLCCCHLPSCPADLMVGFLLLAGWLAAFSQSVSRSTRRGCNRKVLSLDRQAAPGCESPPPPMLVPMTQNGSLAGPLPLPAVSLALCACCCSGAAALSPKS